eukprot:1831176-Pyramimonas_sp.AAC.1
MFDPTVATTPFIVLVTPEYSTSLMLHVPVDGNGACLVVGVVGGVVRGREAVGSDYARAGGECEAGGDGGRGRGDDGGRGCGC